MGARRACAQVSSGRQGAGEAVPGSWVHRAGVSLGPAGWDWDEL